MTIGFRDKRREGLSISGCGGWWILGVGVPTNGLWRGGGERSLRDTPPFAKSAKGRAPRVVAGGRRTGECQYKDSSPSASLRVRMTAVGGGAAVGGG